MIDGCVLAAGLVDARTAIRIDCRADRHGVFKLFDLNMKPNMTGPGRPRREDQDCLSAIAPEPVAGAMSICCRRCLLPNGGARRRAPFRFERQLLGLSELARMSREPFIYPVKRWTSLLSVKQWRRTCPNVTYVPAFATRKRW
jgi:hypothetical protein